MKLKRILAFLRAHVWMISLPYAGLVKLDEIILNRDDS